MARTVFALIITALIPLAAYAGNTALLQAACTNDSTSIQALLARGLDPNSRGENSATALMLAAAYGHAEVARILIDRGADIKIRSESGGTPMAYAVGWGHRDVVELLQRTPRLAQTRSADLIPTLGAVLIGLLALIAIPVLIARLNRTGHLQTEK